MITLSPQQIIAFDQIMSWFKDPYAQTYALAGYAGTGKSTLAKMIAAECGRTVYLAYTGKAANVLRDKGCANVSTIHAAIYDYVGDDESGNPMFENGGSGVDLRKADLVIVDEFSMLPRELVRDLEASGAKKILYLGDPFQLPPVNGECPIKANYFLEEIHRQALDSPILRAATKVRQGEALSFVDDGDFKYLPKKQTDRSLYLNADQVICGKNWTRRSYNASFRKFLGFSGDLPQKGEKMICLKNNKADFVYNGMIGVLDEDAREGLAETYHITMGPLKALRTWNGDVLGKEAPKGLPYTMNRFDYGYTITAHKSQGSEFNNVVVLNEPVGRGVDAQKWLYTAITRAAKQCTLVAA